ncbi:MAG: clostripain-related cysteine peptidase, partial [Actinobacteria bacterium]|nr:clostripain-related cysteine peptidase [Actinomycetota bacterium]
GGGAAAAPATTTTVMVYMAADNNLEAVARFDLNGMEAVGSNGTVDIVVQIDTRSVPVAGSTTAKRLHMLRDGNPNAVTSPVVDDLGERDSADATEVGAFVGWAMSSFPADRYVLILWDHGGGWQGFGTDDSSVTGPMSLGSLSDAIEAALAAQNRQRLDLIGFNACLMGTAEVAHQFAASTRYLVVSEEVEWLPGWQYASVLGSLVANPAMPIRDLAALIPERKGVGLAGLDHEPISTLTALDLERLPDALVAFDTLLAEIQSAGLGNLYEGFGRAAYKSAPFGSPVGGEETYNLRDIGRFLSNLESAAGSSATLRAAAQVARSEFEDVVIAKWSGPVHAQSLGLSILMPLFEIPDTYRDLDLTSGTAWREVLEDFTALSAADSTPPGLDIVAASHLVGPSPREPATLDLEIDGDDAIDLQGGCSNRWRRT